MLRPINIRLKEEIYDLITETAKKQNRSRANFIETLILTSIKESGHTNGVTTSGKEPKANKS